MKKLLYLIAVLVLILFGIQYVFGQPYNFPDLQTVTDVGNVTTKSITAGAFNSTTNYKINSSTVLQIPGTQNLFVAPGAGAALTSGVNDVFLGFNAGNATTSGSYNICIGARSGDAMQTASFNTFIGFDAGGANTTGENNMFLGLEAGLLNTTGNYNTFIGRDSGAANTINTTNTYIGYNSGLLNNGSGNVFLGANAGAQQTVANGKLFIDSSNTNSPLIYGDFSSDIAAVNGSLGVGTISPATTLGVVGRSMFGNVDLGSIVGIFSSTSTSPLVVQGNAVPNGGSLISTAQGNVTSGNVYAINANIASTADGYFAVQQNDNGGAVFAATVLGTGDAKTLYAVNGGQNWVIGLDHSDSSKFKISSGASLGTNDYFTLDTSGHVGLGATSPAQTLDVSGKVSISDELRLNNQSYTRALVADSNGGFMGGYNVTGNAVPATGIRVDSNGNSIGTWITSAGIEWFGAVAATAGDTPASLGMMAPSGEVKFASISGDGTGKVVCIKSDGNLGTCSSVVGAGGTCTCG